MPSRTRQVALLLGDNAEVVHHDVGPIADGSVERVTALVQLAGSRQVASTVRQVGQAVE